MLTIGATNIQNVFMTKFWTWWLLLTIQECRQYVSTKGEAPSLRLQWPVCTYLEFAMNGTELISDLFILASLNRSRRKVQFLVLQTK